MLPYPNIDPIAVAIGPFAVHWYGLAYVAGFFCGLYYFKYLCRKYPLKNLTPELTDAFFLSIVVGVIIGGRFGHIVFYNPAPYLADPWEILRTWNGGMNFHGGVIGVAVAVFIFSWWNKFHPADLADRFMPGVCFGLFFGRVANFINSEIWGKPTDFYISFIFPRDPTQLPRHPAQLYEAVLEGIVLFAILHTVARKRLRRYELSGLFLIGYGVFRFGVEFVKDAHVFVGPLSMGQFLCVPMIVIGLFLLYLSRRYAPAPKAA